MTTVRADPAELTRLARSTLDATKALAAVQVETQAQLSLAPGAFGGIVAELPMVHRAVAEAADSVIEGLVSTLTHDADNLYRIAFRYKELDETGATRVHAAGSGARP